ALVGEPASAQQRRAADAPANDDGFRKLAPGVVTEIPPKLEEEETFSGPREMVGLLKRAPNLGWDPKLLAESETLQAMASSVVFRHAVWGLEFGFKPMRIIDVDRRLPDGTTRNERVYYLVYYVKNNGRHLNPAPEADEQGNETYTPQPVDHTVRFFPSFVLMSHDLDRAYLDEIIPEAMTAIRRREDPNRTFYNSVSISTVALPVSNEYEDNSVWGIATWTGVDPRSDFFSVFVQGLTNAYRWQDPPEALSPEDPPLTGRRFQQKTLQLNFWRPGDAVAVREDEIRYGVPNKNQVPASRTADDVLKIYGLKDRVDSLWVYR
ncbi:MAG: hypothetical protein KDA81_10430, partial [Planctomycetaceae bacterium]|nr:hypothetical protein [Planctomycetaceae bacterium]